MRVIRVAALFDSTSERGRFVSPDRPRLPDPEIRHRVIGYLRSAPHIETDWRSDGRWAWPENAATQAEAGIGPQPHLLLHMRQQDFTPPDRLDSAVVEAVKRAVANGSRESMRDSEASYHVGVTAAGDRTDLVIRTVNETTVRFARSGWEEMPQLPDHSIQLAAVEASDVLDDLVFRWHADALAEARESAVDNVEPRLARVFDRMAGDGTPYFSPNRPRIAESARRERIATYLSRGRLVVRANSVHDPLDPQAAALVPLHMRTDGRWVWQEASAYYLRVRGIAPELALVCHIEAHGCRLPDEIPLDQLMAAATVAGRGAEPVVGPGFTYHLASGTPGQPTDAPLVRISPDGRQTEVLTDSLRWSPFDELGSTGDLGLRQLALVAITEAEASQVMDVRFARRCQVRA